MLKDFCSTCNKITPFSGSFCFICAKNEKEEKWKQLSLDKKVEELKERIEILERKEQKYG